MNHRRRLPWMLAFVCLFLCAPVAMAQSAQPRSRTKPLPKQPAQTPPPQPAPSAPTTPSEPSTAQPNRPAAIDPQDVAPAAPSVPPASRGSDKTPPPVNVPPLRTEAPYFIPSMGLSIYLPEDTLVDLSRIEGGRTTVTITPQGDTRTFVFQVFSSISADRTLDLSKAFNNILDQRKQFHTTRDARGRPISAVRIFDRDDAMLLGQLPASRAYLDVPSDPDVHTTGYTIFQNGPGQFVVFQMDCPVYAFPKVRELYELMVASVVFRDPEELGADRAAALLAGESLFEQLDAQDLDAMLDESPQFYRLYRPAPGGLPSDEQEVGYQRVQIRRGQAGELDTRRSRDKWTDSDKEPGLFVRVDARVLALDSVVDTISMFFLSAERDRELWSISMVVRSEGEAEQWNETGIRRGERLTVKTTPTGQEATSAEWSPLPKGYIARVDTYLLPRLVAHTKTPGSFGFYSYESNLGKMTLRRDSFKLDEDSRTWMQVSLPSENSQTIETTLDAQGKIIRRVHGDGQVMEPIDHPRLRKIWQDKKLPLN